MRKQQPKRIPKADAPPIFLDGMKAFPRPLLGKLSKKALADDAFRKRQARPPH
jgi:hypothetical protein